MKKRMSLGLAIIMVLSLLFYVNVFAVGDNGLENAIKIAKSKIKIPAEYTVFNYSSGDQDQKVWSMDWSKKDGSGSISVGVSEKGNIVSYYKFDNNTSGVYKKKLPKVSKQDAVAKAEAFIKSINPEVLSQIKYLENNQSFNENLYVLNFVRMVNGIRFPDNYANVSVHMETGEVVSYGQNWTEGVTFPDAKKVITKEAAQKFFKENIGLEMSYRLKYENEKYSTYPVYSPKFENSFIDAFTGEKVDLNSFYGIGGMYKEDATYSVKLNYSSNQDAPVSLTPDEIKAIEEVSNILSKEDMEKKLREVKVLGLTDEFSVMNASMTKDYVNKDRVIWSFYFAKNGKDKVMQESVSVSADAKTGEIRDFWISDSKSQVGEPKFDKDASKAAVEKFLQEIQPDKFKTTEYFENTQVKPLLTESNEKPTEFNFSYRRIVNGIAFPSNNISATFDAVSGKIRSYNVAWFDVKFSELDKVVPLEKVYESLFKDIGLEMQYRSSYKNLMEMKIAGPSGSIKPEIKLVYALNDKKPSIFDAMTGEILTYEGKPYEEQKAPEYTDIKGHFAEKKIKILADFGIYFEGKQFNPDKKITQLDYMKLLYSILNYGNSMSPSTVASKTQIEEMYNFLIREGVIKEKEKAPNSNVTREDSVKFLVRMLKYDKVADLKDIFKCNYKDKSKINKDLVGYVVIADALNLIHGTNGFFNPKNTLTKAEAMILTYNYLQI